MGRGKLSLSFMSNRNSRFSTFKKRKCNLMKKAYELSTLCDVPVCLLINGPASAPHEDQSQSEFHTWPPNSTDIQPMIRAYKNNISLKRKCFGLFDFFLDRKMKIETDICKVRENVDELLCPKWDERLDCLSESQLRELMDGLDSKIQAATGIIDFMEADSAANLFDESMGFTSTDYADLFDEPTAFSSWDGQNALEMGGDFNAAEMPPPLVDMDFPDFSVCPIGDCHFEPLPPLFEDHDEYSNNLELLMMGGLISYTWGASQKNRVLLCIIGQRLFSN